MIYIKLWLHLIHYINKLNLFYLYIPHNISYGHFLSIVFEKWTIDIVFNAEIFVFNSFCVFPHLIFWDPLLSFFTFQHCSNQLYFDQRYNCKAVKCNHVQLDWKSSWSHATVDLYNTYTSLTRYYNRKTYPKI